MKYLKTFENYTEKYKDYNIEIKDISKDQVQAIIYFNEKVIGSVTVDDKIRDPYVCISWVDPEHQKMGLGRYVYDLMENYIGKKLSHGDICSSVSAIKLWRKKLNDPNYLPDNFYDYWGDDAEEILKELTMG